MKRLRFVWFVLFAMHLAAARPALSQLINIDDPNANPNNTVVNGINNNGVVVGYYFDKNTGAQHIFTYNLNTQSYTTIPDAPGFGFYVAGGINDSGDISGQCTLLATFQQVGFIRSGSTGTQTVVVDPTSGETTSQLAGINNNGIAVGTFEVGAPIVGPPVVFHGFTFNDSTNAFATVDAPGTGPGVSCGNSICNPPGGSTFLNGINTNGSIVAVFIQNLSTGQTQNTGFLFPAGSPITLPIQIADPNAVGPFGTIPTAVNDNGVIAGIFFDGSGSHGFLSPGINTFSTFDAAGSTSATQINGINNNGVIVGTYTDSSNVGHGFAFIPGGGAPTDVSSQVSVTRGGFRFNFTTHQFIQADTLTNNSASAIAGPIYLVLDNLSANVSLANATGVTANVAPLGSPFITVVTSSGSLAPGAQVSINLLFNDPPKSPITYNTRVLAGGTIAP